jgi:hypothetical protein
MKKILILLFAAAGLHAQETNPLGTQLTPADAGKEAPSIVTNKFNSEFPNTKATWRNTGDNYSAEFTASGTNLKKTVVYDSFGNKLYNESEIAPGDYPKSISTWHRNHDPETKYAVYLHEQTGSEPWYYSIQKADTVRFDRSGHIQRSNNLSDPAK